jgi:hypothetical protein
VEVSQSLPGYVKHIATTEIIAPKSHRKKALLRAFDHNCNLPINERDVLRVVDNQALRNLRHRLLSYKINNTFSMCNHCLQGFTNKDLVSLYCHCVGRIGDPPLMMELDTQGKILIPKVQMHALCIAFQ